MRQAVGESLDWSAPDLLKALGLPMEDLVNTRMATWKRHVTLKSRDGCSEHYVPTPWLAGPPFHIELRTLHVDRMRLDQELLQLTIDSGVNLVRDKVVRVERNGKKISAVQTAGGARLSSPWFIDASGLCRMPAGAGIQSPAIQFGPAKVAMWTYFPVTESIEGTTLYMEPISTEYLDWIWEIPISPNVVSVGYVTTGAATKPSASRDSPSRNLPSATHKISALRTAVARGPAWTSRVSLPSAPALMPESPGRTGSSPEKLRRWWIPSPPTE